MNNNTYFGQIEDQKLHYLFLVGNTEEASKYLHRVCMDDNVEKIVHSIMKFYLQNVSLANLGLWKPLDALKSKILSEKDASNRKKWLSEMTELLCKSPKNSSALCYSVFVGDLEVQKKIAEAYYPSIHEQLSRVSVEKLTVNHMKTNLALALQNKSLVSIYWAFGVPGESVFEFLKQETHKEIAEMLPIAASWFKELQSEREGFLCWLVPLVATLQGIPVSATSLARGEDRVYPEFVDFYYDVQKAQGTNLEAVHEAHREKNAFKFHVRARAVASDSKPDSYFAQGNEENEYVFVKGPYPSWDSAYRAVLNMRQKAKNNLPVLPVKVKMLVPDMFDTIPVGFRKNIDRSKAHAFLVSPSLIPVSGVKAKSYFPKKGTVSQVVDFENTRPKVKVHAGKMTSAQVLSYVKSILFRYVSGCGDLSDRNFVTFKNQVIGVDEEGWNLNLTEKGSLGSQLKSKEKLQIVRECVQNRFKELGLSSWSPFPEPEQNNRLEIVKNQARCLELFS